MRSVERGGIGLWLLAGGLAVGLACTPDETGYGEDTGSGVGNPEAGVDLGAEDGADGDVGSRGSAVYYAPSAVLGDAAIDVTVVAPAGSFAGSDVDVGVVGGAAASPLVVFDGGFVGTVVAAADDIVQVTVDGAEAASVTLVAGAGEASPPEADDSDPAGAPAPSVVDGSVAVGDGALGVPAPYVAWVVETGSAARVESGDVDASLSAEAGDTLCVSVPEADAEALGRPDCVTL